MALSASTRPTGAGGDANRTSNSLGAGALHEAGPAPTPADPLLDNGRSCRPLGHTGALEACDVHPGLLPGMCARADSLRGDSELTTAKPSRECAVRGVALRRYLGMVYDPSHVPAFGNGRQAHVDGLDALGAPAGRGEATPRACAGCSGQTRRARKLSRRGGCRDRRSDRARPRRLFKGSA